MSSIDWCNDQWFDPSSCSYVVGNVLRLALQKEISLWSYNFLKRFSLAFSTFPYFSSLYLGGGRILLITTSPLYVVHSSIWIVSMQSWRLLATNFPISSLFRQWRATAESHFLPTAIVLVLLPPHIFAFLWISNVVLSFLSKALGQWYC